MAQLLRDQQRALAGRPWRTTWLWIAAIVDVLIEGSRERRRRRQRASSPGARVIMNAYLKDVRYGCRLLWRQPGFSAVAVLVLALGIGANTAMFTIVNGLLIKPLTGHPDGALAQVFSKDTSKADTFRAFSYPNYADLRAHTEVFASLAAHNFALAGIDDGAGGAMRQVFVDVVTANFFDTFGVRPMVGRAFTLDEERPGANLPVAILSFPAWQRLGSPGDILGRTIRVNLRPFTIVGVASRGFGGSMAFVTPELWLPTGMYDTVVNDFMRDGVAGTLASRAHNTLVLVAQLRPGETMASAGPALDLIGKQMAAAYPADNKDQALILAPLSRLSVSTSPVHEGPMNAFGASLLVMSGVVLLIASFNLANMLLARGATRRREFAVRSAIGGGRWPLTRQLLIEGFILALAGGGLGLLLAFWSTHALVAAVAGFSPVAIAFDAAPDSRVLAATIGCCGLATILFGLGPALGLTRADTVPALKDRPGDAGGGRRLRLQHVLVMGQLALSLVMLTISGLFLRGAFQATHIDPGFTFDRGVMIHAEASLGAADRSTIRPTYARLLDALRARPDVAAAGAASTMPFGDIEEDAMVQKAGAELPDKDPGLVEASYAIVSAGYFNALDLRVLDGRDFSASEERSDAGERLAIIDRPLAQKLFATSSPIGQQVQYRVHVGQPPVVLRVVGVVPGLRQDVFDDAPVPHIYLPLGQSARAEMFVHVRTSAPTAEAEAALLPSIRRTVETSAAGLPVLAIETRAMFRDRNLMFSMLDLGAAIFLVFGGVALVLTMAGVYGVKAYVVSNRTREIGIRVALGATPSGVVWTIVREGFVLSAVGLAIGTLFSIAAGAGMRAFTFGNTGADTVTVGGAMVVLALGATLASWIPARKAAHVQPTEALRAE